MQQTDAEAAAARIFLWITGDSERLAQFFSTAGIGPADVEGLARTADFLAAVVDFVMQDDASVLAAAAAIGVRPEDMAAVRAALPGGAFRHWT